MGVYIFLVAATLVLGMIMPQKGRNRKYYIIIMAAAHAFVCAFRYQHLTGDLMKYHYIFNGLSSVGWLSESVIQQGRNSGFQFLMKLVNELTGGDFQVLLIVIAVVVHVNLGYVIHRYSPAPWLSFLTWNCMAFYIFGFSAIKQAVAMSFVMLAFVGIEERNLKKYLMAMLAAGLFHVPALVFLPAYWLCQMRIKRETILMYLVLGVLLYIFKNRFVTFIKSFYYDDDEVFVFSGEIGSRFIMILGIAVFGILFRGFSNRTYEKLFHIMVVAAILQMLAGFDNIFTRMTDYYFQMAVLYIPMTFRLDYVRHQKARVKAVFPFNDRSLMVLAAVFSLFMLWFYWTYSLNITISNAVDNYLNFRFMWDVP